ncbi:hypothetical protein IAR55_007206 [Kwoniella newhampshirensis]|uniref:Zn(2)-C6 fungal-type domain-containing protein n=1 Tax=Kwoniella newhampshirensis TaxID=1651941 RepID=A0AAW0YFP6_9TREE
MSTPLPPVLLLRETPTSLLFPKPPLDSELPETLLAQQPSIKKVCSFTNSYESSLEGWTELNVAFWTESLLDRLLNLADTRKRHATSVATTSIKVESPVDVPIEIVGEGGHELLASADVRISEVVLGVYFGLWLPSKSQYLTLPYSYWNASPEKKTMFAEALSTCLLRRNDLSPTPQDIMTQTFAVKDWFETGSRSDEIISVAVHMGEDDSFRARWFDEVPTSEVTATPISPVAPSELELPRNIGVRSALEVTGSRHEQSRSSAEPGRIDAQQSLTLMTDLPDPHLFYEIEDNLPILGSPAPSTTPDPYPDSPTTDCNRMSLSARVASENPKPTGSSPISRARLSSYADSASPGPSSIHGIRSSTYKRHYPDWKREELLTGMERCDLCRNGGETECQYVTGRTKGSLSATCVRCRGKKRKCTFGGLKRDLPEEEAQDRGSEQVEERNQGEELRGGMGVEDGDEATGTSHQEISSHLTAAQTNTGALGSNELSDDLTDLIRKWQTWGTMNRQALRQLGLDK